MKIKELFESPELYIPDTVRDILSQKSGIIHDGRLMITDQTGNCSLGDHFKLVQNNEIIFPLAGVEGDFDCTSFGLKSFKNFPPYVASDIYASSNNFTSLEGITPEIGNALDLSGCEKITSLEGVHLHIKECNYMFLPPRIKEGGLGLLKIKNLEQINIDQSDDYDDDVLRFINIINNHLPSKNILACTNELRIAKLYNYAKF
jgi:hypothetical protein